MSAARRRWPSLSISGQILTLLLSGLVVAQVVTLGLTMLLPPKPPEQHSLTDIAQALRGAQARRGPDQLIRRIEPRPPSLQSAGWVVSARSTRELAQMLDAPENDVRLLFYAPPPLAGAAPPPMARLVAPGAASFGFFLQGPGGPPPGGGVGPPGGGFPGGPGGGFPGGYPGGGYPGGGPSGHRNSGNGASASSDRSRGAARAPAAQPASGGSSTAARAAASGAAPAGGQRGEGPPFGARTNPGPFIRSPLDAAVFSASSTVTTSEAASAPAPVAAPALSTPRSDVAAPGAPAPVARQYADTQVLTGPPAAALAAVAAPQTASIPSSMVASDPLPPPTQRLFGLASAPNVEGQFVAALRVGADQWATVRPQPESFPTSWQRRIALWFLLAFAIVAPVGWLVARRLSAPLKDFALAAERLGRDPSAEVSTAEGPAEVGRAARAFNLMQRRLKRYVEDRTGMVSAISHDLRTPLARMRFRLERLPPDLRPAMQRDIEQMEAMISSVLMFMRDEAVGGRRDRVDLRSILECVVDEAGAEEGRIALAPGAAAEVEVDVLGVQRVFENLIGNALKYAEQAEVRLSIRDGEVVTEIADRGPGLPDEELEQVFKPFYRTPEARSSLQGGVGLGLAVSRSTVRAHGGELQLIRTPEGLTAEVRLPAATTLAVAA
jgi:two-component system OmpR family sensor kinase